MMGAWALLCIAGLLCLALVAEGLLRRGKCFEFPFIMAALTTLFILPQMPALIMNGRMPDGSIERALAFLSLCIFAAWYGWHRSNSYVAIMNWTFDERSLLRAAAILSLSGAFFFYKFGQLSDEERLRGLLTGTAVAYLFFAKLLTYGFAIAVVCGVRRPSLLAIAIILFDAAFYAERIFIAGRRSEAAEFCFIVALALWFGKGRAVPRPLVAVGLVIAFVGLLIAEDYRAATHYSREPDWAAVQRIDVGQKAKILLQDGGHEIRNMVHAIDKINEEMNFDYGLSLWNAFIFRYVPAQIVGYNIKNSLYLQVGVDSYFDRNYLWSVGSTSTGMADAFASFWYFGFIKFYLISLIMRSIYLAGRNGNTMMQILYMLSFVPAALTITHVTNNLPTEWVHVAAFLVPALYLSRRHNETGVSSGARSGHPRWRHSRGTP